MCIYNTDWLAGGAQIIYHRITNSFPQQSCISFFSDLFFCLHQKTFSLGLVFPVLELGFSFEVAAEIIFVTGLAKQEYHTIFLHLAIVLL